MENTKKQMFKHILLLRISQFAIFFIKKLNKKINYKTYRNFSYNWFNQIE